MFVPCSTPCLSRTSCPGLSATGSTRSATTGPSSSRRSRNETMGLPGGILVEPDHQHLVGARDAGLQYCPGEAAEYGSHVVGGPALGDLAASGHGVGPVPDDVHRLADADARETSPPAAKIMFGDE